jgi:DNA-binding NarL/FixJ family response regulator
MNNKIRIAIASDDKIYLAGIEEELNNIEGIEICLVENNGIILINKLENINYDIVIIDLKIPVVNGNKAIEIISEKCQFTKIIFLIGYLDEDIIKKIIKTKFGAIIFKPKCDKNVLDEAIKCVLEGEIFYSKELYKIIIKIQNEEQIMKSYTEKELKVLELISKGYDNFIIADKLFISPKTVEYYKGKLLAKTKSNNLGQLMMYAVKNKLINLE